MVSFPGYACPFLEVVALELLPVTCAQGPMTLSAVQIIRARHLMALALACKPRRAKAHPTQGIALALLTSRYYKQLRFSYLPFFT